MKRLILGAAFACAAPFASASSTPATAQELRFRAGPDGVVVRNDPPRRFEGRYGRPFAPRQTRTIRELPNGCQLVTTRTRRGDGSVVVRRFRRC